MCQERGFILMEQGIKYLAEIAEALSERHAAVMVGAGFSKNAEKVNMNNSQFLDWNQLSDLFYDKIYADPDHPGKNYNSSLRLAQEVEITIGRAGLEKMLKQAIPDQDYAPSALYVDLMKLPWNDVFTTNYDTLLERAADMVSSRRYNVVVCQEDLVNSNDAPRIIKLHGSFPSQRPFIITEEDYRTYPLKFAAMVNTVQQALLENVFCMLGFSCEDPNFINWIGWIHDNLGKSNSQKIYMISVNHIAEAKQKLYLERNIVVIDLEAIWPKKSVPDRLQTMFQFLEESIEKDNVLHKWNNALSGTLDSNDYENRCQTLKNIRANYPGWIFMPWEYRPQVDWLLQSMDFLPHFNDIPFNTQVDYMYEYVKVYDIAGRPLHLQTARMFGDILHNTEGKSNLSESANNPTIYFKIQSIYIHLLRTSRELAHWEWFEACLEKIDVDKLPYDEKQFIYSEMCRRDLFRFQSDSLSNKLDTWKTASSDIYWPLIKASLLALTGEFSKADAILTDNLTLVRKQLMKESPNAYLASIEESVVSLLNFVRQADYDYNLEHPSEEKILEKCLHEGHLSWWDENESYIVHLQAEDVTEEEFTKSYTFNLSITYTHHWFRSTDAINENLFIAMEYWRFMEQTGHVFRLGNVTNTKGLEKSVQRMRGAYPGWTFVQLLISHEVKPVEILLGRKEIDKMTWDEADTAAREYLDIFSRLISIVNVKNGAIAKNVYENAAGVLPCVIARLCSKCSTEVLDEILNTLLELNLSGKIDKFKKLNELFEGVIRAYSAKEQYERLEKILTFPITTNHFAGYWDPIGYIKIPTQRLELEHSLYNKTIFQIKKELDAPKSKEKQDALYRLKMLYQIIVFEKEDERYLFSKLREINGVRENFLLYHFKAPEHNDCLYNIWYAILDLMKKDSIRNQFTGRQGNYEELLWILPNITLSESHIYNLFETMLELLETMEYWTSREPEALTRIRQTVLISSSVFMNIYNEPDFELHEDTLTKIKQYINRAHSILGRQEILEIAYSHFVQKEPLKLQNFELQLWTCSEDDMSLIREFIQLLMAHKINLDKCPDMNECLKMTAEIIVHKTMCEEIIQQDSNLRILTLLNNYGCINDELLKLLDKKLFMLTNETAIEKSDSEQTANHKVLIKFYSCRLAASIYKYHQNCDFPGVMVWKKIHDDDNAFVELRSIDFS